MANFLSSMSASVSTGDGASLSRALASQGLNAKVILDDVFTAGVISLTPYLASIAIPKFILVVIGNTSGAKINFDGVGASTTLKMRTMLLEVTSASAASIAITTTETGRIQMIALGDADA